MIDLFAVEYGWTIEDILNIPWAVLDDLVQRIAERYGAIAGDGAKPSKVDDCDDSAVKIYNELLKIGGSSVVVI